MYPPNRNYNPYLVKPSPSEGWSDITTEVIRKYAINTVTIAHLGTNCETIQVNLLRASKLTRVHQSAWFSKVHNSVKLDVRS